MKNIYLLLLALFTVGSLQAQSNWCGSTHANEKLLQEHPENLKIKRHLDSLTLAGQYSKRGDSTTVYIIPVVFHIIHNYGPENISDDQIYDQMRILNEDFRKLNADTAAIVPSFRNIAADAKIEFRLAQVDNKGNCTNGIDRIPSLLTYQGNDAAKLNPWPRDYYLNIWVVADMANGVAGYAYYPSAVEGFGALIDGIMIRHNYIGSIGTGTVGGSRALTHEIGHSLNLPHTWGNTNEPGVACGDDGILDTPETAGWTTCNLNAARCNPPVVENVQNYMEYSFCSRMFTKGQVDAMRLALTTEVSGRDNLWSAQNLAYTGVLNPNPNSCAPKADFYATKKVICTNENLVLRNASWGGEVTSVTWEFEGGTPQFSSDFNPSVSFATPGWHKITLTATGPGGSDIEEREEYIFVTPDVPSYATTFVEGFENENRYKTEWGTLNLSFNESAWQRTTETGYYSPSSVYLNSYNSVSEDVDELVTPPVFLDGGQAQNFLHFKYACATGTQNSGDVTETLRIFYSVNCGASWTLMKIINGAELVNNGFVWSEFTPDSDSDWSTYNIELPQGAKSGNTIFKFQYTSGTRSNNLYLDNINLALEASTGIAELEVSDLSVFPNPNTGQFTVNYSLSAAADINIELYNLLGQRVDVLENGTVGAGSHQITVDNNLPEGVYTLRLAGNGQVVTQKIVVTGH